MARSILRGWLLVLLAALAIAAAVLVQSLLPAGPLLWDEAYHALWGARIAADARAGDVLALLYDSYRQVYWPPLYSWLAGLVIFFAGYSTELVRAIGLVALIGTALLLYAAARPFASGRAGEVGGVAAGAVLLFSSAALELAPQAMLELPALFFLVLGLWLYGWLWRSPAPPPAAWGGLGATIVLTFLAKQNYGVLLGLAVAGAFLVEGEWLRRQPSAAARTRRRGHLLAAGTTALLLLLWFAYPQKIVQTLQSLRNTPWGPDASTLEGVLFYPRQFGWLAGSWLMAGVWLAALGAVLRRRALADGRIWILVVLIAFQLLFAQLSATKIARHILPLVPAFAILVGAQAARLSARWPRLTAGALAALLGVHAAMVLPGLRPVGDPAARAALAAAVDAVGPATIVVGNIDLPYSPATLDWELLRRGVLTVDGAGALTLASEIRFAGGVLPRLPEAVRQPLGRLPTRWPGERGAATLYIGLPLDAPDLELRAGGLSTAVVGATGRRPFERAVALVPTPSPRFPDATPEALEQALARAGFRVSASRAVGSTVVMTLER
ncbi:MAG: hypothetical protein RMM58_06645 [Chloroflexota bacterium]|nr:hypothetical protein [Dehalococcoidia bacterium]MDW8253540.1 hypothetical protein [Chloroflexota bacterium]